MPQVKAHAMPDGTRRQVRWFSRCRGTAGLLGPTHYVGGPRFPMAHQRVSLQLAWRNGRGQDHAHTDPALIARGFDRAVMLLDDTLYKREPQSPPRCRLARRPGTIERFEEMSQIVRWNGSARIADFEDHVRFCSGHTQSDFASRRTVLHGVVQQIKDHTA